jgi:non-ribosomal peptide synthetase component E (peptide arylation enzyme)
VQADFPGHDLVGLARDVARAQPSLRVLLTINAANPTNGAIGIESLGADRAPADARVIVDSVQHGIAPDSLAVLQLSGGTTNVPKLIPRLHAEYWYNAKAYARAVQLKPGDCVAHILPVVHNAGIVCGVHAAHSVGSCFATAAHDPAEITALVRRQPPTHMMMAPPIAQMVLADDDLREALRSLRRMVWTLGKLPPQVREVFETDTCMIQQLYGQGEGLCMVTPAEAPPEIRHHTVGAPVCAFDEIRVYFPNTENPVPVGVPGELCCRGPYTLRGYYRAPERNIEAFTSDGFYRSGDIVVELQAPGGPFYAVEDRLKDVISRGGEKINALEVEELLVRHAAIEAAALVAMPDERLGERACAVLVLRDGAEAPGIEDLRAFLDDLGVAKFKWPERIELRDALPLTSVDKVNKALLRREVADILAAKR